MTLIIPRTSNPLRVALRDRSKRQFANQVALADALSGTVVRVAKERQMRIPEVMDGLLCSICSVVQGAVPENEWDDVGAILADELRSRLTVTGVN
jgi:hypothetical protein